MRCKFCALFVVAICCHCYYWYSSALLLFLPTIAAACPAVARELMFNMS
jgi:hypothetical protein